MKKNLGMVFLMAMLSGCGNPTSSSESVSSSIEEIPGRVQVVILLGQSNMEGHSYVQYLPKTMGEEKAREYISGYPNVSIAYACSIANNTSGGQFVPVKTGQGLDASRFGPEVGIAETLSEANLSEDVFLIKFAQGATSLYSAWRSPSSQMSGALYLKAVEYIKNQLSALETLGYYPEIKAICWMQGEDDSSSPYYADYYTYLKSFVNDLRNELLYYGDPEGIGFVDAGISDCPAWTHYQDINSAKQQLAAESEWNVYLDTISEKLRYNGEPAGSPDIYHYDSSSMIQLGRLFASILLERFLTL